jgi:prepilin-type N-terminal cleavage/methylation domain-containing protein
MNRRPSPSACSTRARRAFSIVELLVALTISATLLAATLQAFDASWRSYKQTTNSASTHVVSRIVVHRVLSMIRTGSDFSPVPADVLDIAQNPLTSTFMEFRADADRRGNTDIWTRLERRDSPSVPGTFELWYVLIDRSGGADAILQQRPLLTNVRQVAFILQYDRGPRLRLATLDLTVQPGDDADMRIGVGNDAPTLRMVASASPWQFR